MDKTLFDTVITKERAHEFEVAFLGDLQSGPTTASRTRLRHKLPGGNYVGSCVRRLARQGVIESIGYEKSITPESCSHVEMRWRLKSGKPVSGPERIGTIGGRIMAELRAGAGSRNGGAM